MSDPSERLCATLRKFIERLRSLDGADRKRGLLAAQNIETTLLLLQSDFISGVDLLRGDIGGKGVLDWQWSNEHRLEIERFGDEILSLIDAP